MVWKVQSVFYVLMALLVGLTVAACRDIDEPPPVPVFDPDAPLDGGADSGITKSIVYPCALSFVS